FMLSSTMPAGVREAKGSYPVGGCGGNIEWHTEADTIEVADRENLLRDMRLYAGAVFGAAQLPVHPLDFRRTLDQLRQALARYRQQLQSLVDLDPVMKLTAQVRESRETFSAPAAEHATPRSRPP